MSEFFFGYNASYPGLSQRDRALEEALSPAASEYARVDVVISGEKLLLMELELVEPELFFNYCPESAPLLADLLIEKMK